MQKYFQYKISQLMGNLLTLKLALFQISDSLYSRNVIKIMLEKKYVQIHVLMVIFSIINLYIYITKKPLLFLQNNSQNSVNTENKT